MASSKTAKRLKRLFYDVKNPASFTGIDALYREVNRGKKTGCTITRKQISEWLKSQDAYTLHKPIPRKIKRNRVVVSGIDALWQADLADLSSLSESNKGYKWLLVVIDVFSKYIWCEALKNKSAAEVVRAFNEILSKGRIPKKVQTDQGTEFLNAKLKKLFRKHNIVSYYTFQDVKASVVERAIRTLKTRLWKYFTWKGNYRYIDVLPSLVNSYNHSKHRSIGRAPAEVSKDNEWFVWRKLYADIKTPSETKPPRFEYEIGQKVRLSKVKKIFDKGFERNWSREIFVVCERLPRTPPVYRLKDLAGDIIEGVFYGAELQAVMKEDSDEYRVEKIVKKRKVNGKTEYLVKWEGYPPSFNSWVKEKDMRTI